MRYNGWSILIWMVVVDSALSSDSEWSVVQPHLPPMADKHPERFSLYLSWSKDDRPETTTFYLERSKAVGDKILYFTNDDNGKPSLASLIDLKHTAFYQSQDTHASFSLTNLGGKNFSLQGKFAFNDWNYEIEPFHPRIHKRSLGAAKGDHVVKRHSAASSKQRMDYVLPEPESADYSRVERARVVYEEMQRKEMDREKRSLGDHDYGDGTRPAQDITKRRKTRNTLPTTTYTVELYIAVDYHAYLQLNESAARLDWPGTTDDYISFFIGHQANEIDMRYRMIKSKNWTISTKFSYLNIAKTESASPWTYQSYYSTLVEVDTGLDKWTDWVEDSNLPKADHFMLITGLDITDDGNTNVIGVSNIGGICGEKPTSFSELSSSMVYSHELGHNLGAYHDGWYDNYCEEETQYVMASTIEYPTPYTIGHNWIFSSCSARYFDAFIKVLNEDSTNCLLDTGAYIPSWQKDSSDRFGQAISVDEQCKLFHGEDSYYDRSESDTLCSSLRCTSQYGDYEKDPSRVTFQYTSCGNKKWCEKNICAYHPEAPEVIEGCPFEDRDLPEQNITCAEVTPITCQQSQLQQMYCCRACQVFATPWLGPNCAYGDTDTLCNTVVNKYKCQYNAKNCCKSCCPILGPEEGYSCVQPLPNITTTTPTTTTARTTTTTTPTTTTTHTTRTTTRTTTTTSFTTTTTAPFVTTTAIPVDTASTFNATRLSSIIHSPVHNSTFYQGYSTNHAFTTKDRDTNDQESWKSGAKYGGIATAIVILIALTVAAISKRKLLWRAKVKICKKNDDSSVNYVQMS